MDRRLLDQQRNFVQKSDKYEQLKDDPFYRVEDRNSRFHETATNYILKTFVPEHEKGNVKINIKDDHVSVAGRRAFKDKIEDEDKVIKTNSFQTFREEFKFNQPIFAEGAIQERSGDYVTVTIPKVRA